MTKSHDCRKQTLTMKTTLLYLLQELICWYQGKCLQKTQSQFYDLIGTYFQPEAP